MNTIKRYCFLSFFISSALLYCAEKKVYISFALPEGERVIPFEDIPQNMPPDMKAEVQRIVKNAHLIDQSRYQISEAQIMFECITAQEGAPQKIKDEVKTKKEEWINKNTLHLRGISRIADYYADALVDKQWIRSNLIHLQRRDMTLAEKHFLMD